MDLGGRCCLDFLIKVNLESPGLEEEKAIVLSVGCNDFVRKPFKQETIFQKMAEYLGVKYRYAASLELSKNSGQDDSLATQSIALSMATLSRSWLQQLYQLSTQLRGKEVINLLDDIPEELAILKRVIAAKVNNFDFDQVAVLAKNALDSSSKF